MSVLLLLIFLGMLVVLCRKPFRNRKPSRESEFFCFAFLRADQADQAKQSQNCFVRLVSGSMGAASVEAGQILEGSRS